ncbi:thioesterase family protein [Daeguia caeni]|uniref:Thioesterase family protein n=1 Tax=Daeguia caeni TaxID=439612 RepID=A0ABV9H8E1_9HYPH
MTQPVTTIVAPLTTWTGEVIEEWLDYNGHMTEHRYLQVCGEASDHLYGLIGVDFARAEEGAFYTLQTHLVHLKECRLGTPLKVTSEILGHDDKRLHLYHRIFDGAGNLLATGEHLSIHVAHGKSGPASPAMQQKIAEIHAACVGLPLPAGTGSVLHKPLAIHRS